MAAEDKTRESKVLLLDKRRFTCRTCSNFLENLPQSFRHRADPAVTTAIRCGIHCIEQTMPLYTLAYDILHRKMSEPLHHCRSTWVPLITHMMPRQQLERLNGTGIGKLAMVAHFDRPANLDPATHAATLL